MGNKPKDSNAAKKAKEVNYNNMFYRPKTELQFSGETFMQIKDMVNRATINRTRLVFGANGTPIGRTEVGYENEDIREINTFIDDLHKTFVDGGKAIEREALIKEIDAESKEEVKQ